MVVDPVKVRKEGRKEGRKEEGGERIVGNAATFLPFFLP
jgi:hypothetical protein